MSKSTSSVLMAGLAGLAAGVAIGLLFAPAKGSKTRKRIKKKILNLADHLEDDLNERIGAIRTAFTSEEVPAEEADTDREDEAEKGTK